MNIEIFTFYYTNNYGAQLQSLFLKEFLEENFNLKIEYARYTPKKLIFREIYKPLITKNPQPLINMSCLKVLIWFVNIGKSTSFSL